MTPLEPEIRAIIETEGPMTVSDYMQLCLGHPRHGYYVTRDPLGAGGDFMTAPEVSQMFGELIGAWAAAVWQQMGSPAQVQSRRAWAGPRHADGGRAARRDRHAGFSRRRFGASGRDKPGAARAVRRQTLATRRSDRWHDAHRRRPRRAGDRDRERIRRCAAGRPVRQGSRRLARCAWSASPTTGSAFVAAPDPLLGLSRGADAPSGAILERRHDQPIALLARRIAQHGGAALIIDYGHAESGFGDTLQAVRAHKFADPLDDAGRSRSHHAGRFRRARRDGDAAGRSDAGPGLARRIPAPPRHRAARRAAARRRRRRSRPPTSTRRSRA